MTCDLPNISDHLEARFTVSAPSVYGFLIISSSYFFVFSFSAILLLPRNAVKDLRNRAVQYKVVIPF